MLRTLWFRMLARTQDALVSHKCSEHVLNNSGETSMTVSWSSAGDGDCVFSNWQAVAFLPT